MAIWKEKAIQLIKSTQKEAEKLPPVNSWGVSREEVAAGQIMREAEKALVLGLSEYAKELLLSVKRNDRNDWLFTRLEAYLAAIDEKEVQTPAVLPCEKYAKLSTEAKHVLWYAGIILLRNQLYLKALLKDQAEDLVRKDLIDSPWEFNWVLEAARGKEVFNEINLGKGTKVVEELVGVCVPKELQEKAKAFLEKWKVFKEGKKEGSPKLKIELLRQKSEIEEELFNLKLRYILEAMS